MFEPVASAAAAYRARCRKGPTQTPSARAWTAREAPRLASTTRFRSTQTSACALHHRLASETFCAAQAHRARARSALAISAIVRLFACARTRTRGRSVVQAASDGPTGPVQDHAGYSLSRRICDFRRGFMSSIFSIRARNTQRHDHERAQRHGGIATFSQPGW